LVANLFVVQVSGVDAHPLLDVRRRGREQQVGDCFAVVVRNLEVDVSQAGEVDGLQRRGIEELRAACHEYVIQGVAEGQVFGDVGQHNLGVGRVGLKIVDDVPQLGLESRRCGDARFILAPAQHVSQDVVVADPQEDVLGVEQGGLLNRVFPLAEVRQGRVQVAQHDVVEEILVAVRAGVARSVVQVVQAGAVHPQVVVGIRIEQVLQFGNDELHQLLLGDAFR
jgi:hypothetical protein